MELQLTCLQDLKQNKFVIEAEPSETVRSARHASQSNPRRRRPANMHTLDWRTQVQDPGREGLGSGPAEADLLR